MRIGKISSMLPPNAPAAGFSRAQEAEADRRTQTRTPGANMTTMEQLANTLVKCGLASTDTIRPCTPEEVAEVSADHGLTNLPAEYDEFLRIMGRQAGELLRGTDFFYPSILGLDQAGKELLEENRTSHLFPPGAIVIGMHQGYQLYWLSPRGEVGLYTEGEQDLDRKWPTLLACLVFYRDAYLEARVRK